MAALTGVSTKVRTVVSFGETRGPVDDVTRIRTLDESRPIQVEAGHVLSERYRLDELVARREHTQTWRASDERLARGVVVHLLAADGHHHALLTAARRAAVVSDHRFLRVLDAAIPADAGADGSGIGPYIVCEHASGQSLEDLLAVGPLNSVEAAWLVREVADALVDVHAQGLHHQRLSRANVFVTAGGSVKIGGLLLEAALAADQQPIRDGEAADVQALGRLLDSALGGRWSPEARAGVPSSLDRICDRILNPDDQAAPLRTATDVAAALSLELGTTGASPDFENRAQRLALDPAEAPVSRISSRDTRTLPAPVPASASVAVPKPVAAAERVAVGASSTPPGRPRKRPSRWIRVLVPLGLIVTAGGLIAAVLLPNGLTNPTGSAGPSERWPVVAASDFDPEGNGEERPRQATLAWDDNPATSWRTMNYWEADIGNKTGVGLIFDLGEVRQISRVELDLDGDGTSLEIRVPRAGAENGASAPVDGIDQWNTAGRADRAASATSVTLDQPAQTRYVLIYLTELPQDGSAFTGGIAEARFWS